MVNSSTNCRFFTCSTVVEDPCPALQSLDFTTHAGVRNGPDTNLHRVASEIVFPSSKNTNGSVSERFMDATAQRPTGEKHLIGASIRWAFAELGQNAQKRPSFQGLPQGWANDRSWIETETVCPAILEYDGKLGQCDLATLNLLARARPWQAQAWISNTWSSESVFLGKRCWWRMERSQIHLRARQPDHSLSFLEWAKARDARADAVSVALFEALNGSLSSV